MSQFHIFTGAIRGWQEACVHVPALATATAGAAVELDLGCGKGGFLLELAERYPERTVVGAELMIGRLKRLLKKVEARELANVALLRAEAWEFVAFHLPDALFDRIHVLCPDPWPKARHRANRLVTSEFLGRITTKLRPGGVLHLATDDPPYFERFRAAVDGLPELTLDPDGIADIADIKTDFQRRWEEQGKSLQRIVLRRTP